jgi:hypothetical protein
MPAFSVSSPHHSPQPFTSSDPHQNESNVASNSYVDFQLQRLVRFLARDGRTYYGDAILPGGISDIARAKQARIITGDIFGKHEVSDQVADIRLLLAPLAPEHIRTVRCLGLNYALHAKEVRNQPRPGRSVEKASRIWDCLLKIMLFVVWLADSKVPGSVCKTLFNLSHEILPTLYGYGIALNIEIV